MDKVKRDKFFWLAGGLGITSLANALWMLVGPEHWYYNLPAAVPEFGPYNPHFVRDIGVAFGTSAVALLLAARRPPWRRPLVITALLFFTGHAAIHVYDTARGHVGADHVLMDLPGVFLPPILLLVLLSWSDQ